MPGTPASDRFVQASGASLSRMDDGQWVWFQLRNLSRGTSQARSTEISRITFLTTGRARMQGRTQRRRSTIQNMVRSLPLILELKPSEAQASLAR